MKGIRWGRGWDRWWLTVFGAVYATRRAVHAWPSDLRALERRLAEVLVSGPPVEPFGGGNARDRRRRRRALMTWARRTAMGGR